MKKYFAGTLLLILIAAVPCFAQLEVFLNNDQIVQEIEKKLNTTVYLIEIAQSDDDINVMFVYFLKNVDPAEVKDINSNIDSSKVPVMVATYNFNYDKFAWGLKEIKPFQGKSVFKVN